MKTVESEFYENENTKYEGILKMTNNIIIT